MRFSVAHRSVGFVALWIVGLCAVVTRGAPPEIASIAVFPDKIELTGREATHRVLVTGLTADGREVDLTRTASYAIADDKTAAVDASGMIRSLGDGTTTLTVTAGKHQAKVSLTVKRPPATQPVSFAREVMPVLARAGCNAGACHAKQGGQADFQLSVFAFDLDSDYNAIVKGGRGRRIFPAAPAESLLLKKPTAAVKHGGGRRFERDSKPYRMVLRWLEQGAPQTPVDEPMLVGIEVFPAERAYTPESTQQLLVRARYSDGQVRGVTAEVQFSSNIEEIAEVDEHGLMTVGKLTGETELVVRYMGEVAVSFVTVPIEHAVPDSAYTALPRNNFIDGLVYAKLNKLGMLPSSRCTDGEFIRRASLDAIGVLPTPDETRAFLADADPDKRDKLIDRLLEQPAYADHWAVKWGDLIRANPVRIGVKGVFMLDRWLRQSFAQNKPYDQFAREILTSQGSTHKHGPVTLWRDRRDPTERTTLVSQIFLGVRMECAKCHHHPNEKWSQTDFYQLAAYFGRLERKGAGIAPPISPGEEFFYHTPGGSVKHPVSGEVMAPTPPDGTPSEIPDGRDPRHLLVDWMVQPENPFFAPAIVNRVWAEFMGRGVVDPVDDFRASNPPTNGPLLAALARDFVQAKYDLKHLMRTIMRSQVYQLSSTPNEHNVRDTRNFARSYRRRLPAEVMLDAVSDVVGPRLRLDGLAAGARAIGTWNHRLDSHFMNAFGRPDRSSDCPCERNTDTSVIQALHLMNAEQLNERIADKNGRAAKLAGDERPIGAILEELYLTAYSRIPTKEEIEIATGVFEEPDATRQSATEDVMWALINSAEFVFNH